MALLKALPKSGFSSGLRGLILITSHAPSLVGFRSSLIKDLQANGFRVTALAPNFDELTRQAVIDLGAVAVDCPMARAGMNPLIDALNTWRLMKLLRGLNPEVVVSYFLKPVIFGSIAARLANVPVRLAMVEGLGFVFTQDSRRISIGRKLLKRIVLTLLKIASSGVDRLIFLNPDDRDELIAERVVPREKTFLLGGIGVNLLDWPQVPPVTNPITFLLVARLLREKGVAEFAEAARLVKKKYPESKFILLGGLDEVNPGGIKNEQLQAWLSEGVLDWRGHVEVQPWMAKCSVFVLPSYREGVPVSTQEAMATGRAIITTDRPGCRQTVVDGVNGYLVPAQDSGALAEAMCYFMKNPSLIEKMGAESARMATENYDVVKVNRRLIELFVDVANGKRNSPMDA